MKIHRVLFLIATVATASHFVTGAPLDLDLSDAVSAARDALNASPHELAWGGATIAKKVADTISPVDCKGNKGCEEHQENTNRVFENVSGGAVKGAGVGATIGAFVGGPAGAAAGAALGGAAGSVVGAIKEAVHAG